MLSQGGGSCSTPHRDYERKPEVGDRIELTCISDIYNRLGTVTEVEVSGNYVYIRAKFDNLDIHSYYGASDLRLRKRWERLLCLSECHSFLELYQHISRTLSIYFLMFTKT